MPVCLCVYVSFSDRLQIDVVDAVSQCVDVTGCGQGIAVITLPPLPHRLCLGPCYCGHVARHQFMIVNKGRHQQIVFAVNTANAVNSSKHRGNVITSPSTVLILSTVEHFLDLCVVSPEVLFGFFVSPRIEGWLNKNRVVVVSLTDTGSNSSCSVGWLYGFDGSWAQW